MVFELWDEPNDTRDDPQKLSLNNAVIINEDAGNIGSYTNW